MLKRFASNTKAARIAASFAVLVYFSLLAASSAHDFYHPPATAHHHDHDGGCGEHHDDSNHDETCAIAKWGSTPATPQTIVPQVVLSLKTEPLPLQADDQLAVWHCRTFPARGPPALSL